LKLEGITSRGQKERLNLRSFVYKIKNYIKNLFIVHSLKSTKILKKFFIQNGGSEDR